MRTCLAYALAATVVVAAGTASADAITPPVIETAAGPVYAADCEGSARDADVIVTVDASGLVTDATLVAAGRDALDEVALDAARRYRLRPATRDGKAIRSRIKLRIALACPPRAPATPLPREPPAAPILPAPVAPVADPEVVHVAGDKATQSPTRRTLDHREIETIPGTGGDAIRTVEALPGVARAPAFSGLIILRGSSPQDSQVFIDGASVPLAFHFGGLSAIVPTELVERLDIYPGNYDVSFGRGIGGVIDLGLRSPTREGTHAVAKVDLLDARALVETALDPHTRVLVAARRSYIDAWFPLVADKLALGVTAAPVYYDYQAMIERDLGAHAKLRATFLGSDDRLAVILPPSSGTDPGFTGELQNATVFWRGSVRADGKLQSGARWLAQASLGHDAVSISLGRLLDGHNDVYRAAARAQLDVPLSRRLRLLTGLDVEGGSYELGLSFPAVPADGEPDTGPLFGRKRLEQQRTWGFVNPAAFASLDARPSSALQLIIGLRAESFSDVPIIAAQPRATARYLASADPKLSLKASAGLYSQQPQVYENDPQFGTPGLHLARSGQVSMGVEVELAHRVELSIEPFYKRLYDLVSRRPDGAAASGFRYGNEGDGFAYGTELLLKYRADASLMGWLAYTVSRSERRALPELPLATFTYDQTHVLSALASYRLGAGWEIGARVRYVTGNPFTPVLGGAFDADAGDYSPVEQRPVLSARMPAFFSMDVRVEKKWRLGRGANVSAYLDVMNATNRRNVEGYATTYDDSVSIPVKGLPILPNFGLRGEL